MIFLGNKKQGPPHMVDMSAIHFLLRCLAVPSLKHGSSRGKAGVCSALFRSSVVQKSWRFFKRASSFLLLFQRTPAAQVLLPEVNLISTLASSGSLRTAITVVAGLGAYDRVAGATTLVQLAPSRGASTVTGRVGGDLTAIFQITGTPTPPLGWELESGEVPGMELTYNSGEGIAALVGKPLESGTFPIRLVATHGPDRFGRNFTVSITGQAGVSITAQPTSRTVAFGQSVTLSIQASGSEALSYQWYEGESGDESLPVGGDENTFTTPALETTTNYWVRVSSDLATVNSRTAQITVQPAPPEVVDAVFPAATVGATYSHTVTAVGEPSRFTITGLPRGLRADAVTGRISGRPEVSGVFQVQVRAARGGSTSSPVSFPLVVKALSPGLVGTFGGLIQRDAASNRGLGGFLSLTTTSNGSYTLRASTTSSSGAARAGAVAYSVKGRLEAAAPQISTTVGGLDLQLSLNAETGEMTGVLGTAGVNGWRAGYHATFRPAESLAGYYSAALRLADVGDRGAVTVPQGTGFLTMNVGSNGGLTVLGRTADGQAFSSAAFLGSQGQFWLYTGLYRGGGSLQGEMNLTEEPQVPFLGNVIRGDLTWRKPAVNERAYPAGFGPLNLGVEGAYLAPASRGHVVLGLPETGVVSLRFSEGEIHTSLTNPDLDVIWTETRKFLLPSALENAGRVSLNLNPATGALSGQFSLVDGTFTRNKVAFKGQVIRGADGEVKAAGSFLLPQLPIDGQAANRTAILSGRVELIQVRGEPVR